MCEFLDLYSDVNGYVTHCGNCRLCQIVFGTTVLILSEEDFRILGALARKAELTRNVCNDPRMKSVVLPTPYKGSKLILTETEMHQLYTILENADSVFQANKLLDLFI